MKFSIITPSYNQGCYIQETIESVCLQDYPEFEHIIVDGGSTDQTLNILKAHPHLRWISEQDEGQ
ncbi:MAG: glycosyltransferase [Methylacidiphilales bacterium]|nr:glycosyltransferase [Candidatus Methylacidiphilales bacterium]